MFVLNTDVRVYRSDYFSLVCSQMFALVMVYISINCRNITSNKSLATIFLSIGFVMQDLKRVTFIAKILLQLFTNECVQMSKIIFDIFKTDSK